MIALHAAVACRKPVAEVNPIPVFEAIVLKVSEAHWKKPLPLAVCGHSSAADCFTVALAGLRERLDQYDHAGLLRRCDIATGFAKVRVNDAHALR
jgi:hypothetical protein